MSHRYQDNDAKSRGLLCCMPSATTVSILILLFLCSAALRANDSIDKSDCLIIAPDFDDTALLTREERIQMMDGALKEALSRAQNCRQKLSDAEKQSSNGASARNPSDSDGANTSTSSRGSDAGSSANESSGTHEQNSAEAEQNNAQSSRAAVPADGLSGTETAEQESEDAMEAEGFSGAGKQSRLQNKQDAVPNSELSGTELPKQETRDKIIKSAGGQPPIPAVAKNGIEALNNGKLPEDIPPADNDDIIARQIREAALAESDLQKQAKLWNEYRRYKGMPVK